MTGALLGLQINSSPTQIYRALLDAICFGARTIIQLFVDGGFPVDKIIVTSGLAANNPFLVQNFCDVMGRPVQLPEIENPTAVGAAIHGAVAAGVVASFSNGFAKFGAKTFRQLDPNAKASDFANAKYAVYRQLTDNREFRQTLKQLPSLFAP